MRMITSSDTFDVGAYAQHSAGILPISVDEEGTMHVLLGRERFIHNYKGSCRWSAFEGGTKCGDDGVASTAAREFCEESLGVYGSYETWHARLRDQTSDVARVSVRMRGFHDLDRVHVTFVVAVPWDGDVATRFLCTRQAIEDIDFAQQEHRMAPSDTLLYDRFVDKIAGSYEPARRIVRGENDEVVSVDIVRDFMEKDQVRWWSYDALRQVLHGGGQLASERFRPSFMPVVQLLVEHFAAIAVACGFPVPPARLAARQEGAPASLLKRGPGLAWGKKAEAEAEEKKQEVEEKKDGPPNEVQEGVCAPCTDEPRPSSP